MKKIFVFCFGMIYLLFCKPIHAQTNDLCMWNTFGFEYKLNEKYSFLGTEELRLKENLSTINLLYTNLGFGYKYNSHFKIALVYRNIQKQLKNSTYGFRHRMMLDITYKTKIKEVSFSTRTRLQGEIAYPYASDVWNVSEYYWRQKFEFKYDIPDTQFSPYLGTELRTQFSTPHIKEFRGFGFSRTRIFAGCDYEINKNNSIGMYYLIQNDFQVNDPTTLYVIGLEYSLTLGRKDKVDMNKSVD